MALAHIVSHDLQEGQKGLQSFHRQLLDVFVEASFRLWIPVFQGLANSHQAFISYETITLPLPIEL